MADDRTAEELAAEHKKAELEAAAAVEGIEVRSRDTKADIAEKLAHAGGAIGPRHMNSYSSRSDDDALHGHFVDVVGGEHKGQKAVFVSTEAYDPKGYPTEALIRFRDFSYDHEYATVPYEDVKPARSYNGGR